eukprot:GHVU01010715.1.p3 GENE.GHVU01010715.1~~GHVU01010715.1.p3  ORF type:complete len:115 (-),score=13.71 GHVU01010715.1:340-684(-)
MTNDDCISLKKSDDVVVGLIIPPPNTAVNFIQYCKSALKSRGGSGDFDNNPPADSAFYEPRYKALQGTAAYLFCHSRWVHQGYSRAALILHVPSFEASCTCLARDGAARSANPG